MDYHNLKKTELTEKELRILAGSIYIAFFILILFLHRDVFPCSDDIVFRDYLREYSVFEQFLRTWNYLSGKCLTDTLGAVLTLLPYSVWSVGDSLVWLLLLFLINDIIYDEPAYNHLAGTALLSLLFLMFPINYLTSAGFILTSTNYVYPAVCDTLIIWRIIKHIRTGSIPAKKVYSASFIGECILLFLIAVFGAGQEQSAAILIALLSFLFAKQIFDRVSKNVDSIGTAMVPIMFSLFGALGGLAFVLFSPGHIIRSKVVEGTFCVPGYAEWTFSDKIIRGYSSTVANLIYYQTWLYIAFSIMVFFLGLGIKKRALKIASGIPLAYSMTAALILPDYYSYYPDYGFGMKELIDFKSPVLNAISLIVPLLVFLLICLLIYKGFDNKASAVSVIIVIIVSLGSRIVMGFSATLFGSSFRTFIFLLIALIYCNGMLFKELQNKNHLLSSLCLIICSLISVITVYLNAAILTASKPFWIS